MEANEEKRKEYKEAIKTIEPEKLVYIDESVIEMTICKDKGWSKKGSKIKAKKSGKYYERTNIIAGYVNNKILHQWFLMAHVILNYMMLWLNIFL